MVSSEIELLLEEFTKACSPLENDLQILIDKCTGANYVECHINANSLIQCATIDVPLDPDEQPDYRANREIVEDHAAYDRMKADAANGRSFSNLVCEWSTVHNVGFPLKVIGGQHRYNAIKDANSNGINEHHGVKVYFGLDADQRLDVQLISNTNIAVSSDLLDRMYETVSGPQLRQWCQTVGLLETGTDFADTRKRGQPITVRVVRTLILNFYDGQSVKPGEFETTETTPQLATTGIRDEKWEELKRDRPELWSDEALKRAGKEFALLAQAQQAAIGDSKHAGKVSVDYAEKTYNYAILSAWAYVAGVLQANKVRLDRHYELKSSPGHDPLNAAVLAKGRHKSDPENYRGLGYRTDAKERGRFVELFNIQAEKGDGINKAAVELAIGKYHAKRANLEVKALESKVSSNV